jgi:hypothetical protein
MNITEDMDNMQYMAQGVANAVVGNRTEEYEKKFIICLTPEGDSSHCTSLTDVNNKIWGARCTDCGCPIKIRARSDKGCSRGKW